MKKIITKIKENKKIFIPIFLILIIIIGIFSYFIIDKLIHPRVKDGMIYNEEFDMYMGEEVHKQVNVVDVLRDKSEYLGEYENYEEDKDLGFLTILYRDFASSEYQTGIINSFIDYKFPKGEYVVDANGNKVSIGMNDKKFIIYFTTLFDDEFGNLETNIYGEGMRNNKEDLAKHFDMEVYTLPQKIDVDQKEYLSLIPNGDFYNNSVSKTFAEILNKIENKTSIFLCFNEDGTLLYASGGFPFDVNVEYLELALKSNISIQEAFPKILENYKRDREFENSLK